MTVHGVWARWGASDPGWPHEGQFQRLDGSAASRPGRGRTVRGAEAAHFGPGSGKAPRPKPTALEMEGDLGDWRLALGFLSRAPSQVTLGTWLSLTSSDELAPPAAAKWAARASHPGAGRAVRPLPWPGARAQGTWRAGVHCLREGEGRPFSPGRPSPVLSALRFPKPRRRPFSPLPGGQHATLRLETPRLLPRRNRGGRIHPPPFTFCGGQTLATAVKPQAGRCGGRGEPRRGAKTLRGPE